MPDSIRMVMMPRKPGIVLAGDQTVHVDSFVKDNLRKAAEVKSIRSRQDLEKRLRQLEKELQEMKKQMEKLGEP
jgi:TolA-binding protein